MVLVLFDLGLLLNGYQQICVPNHASFLNKIVSPFRFHFIIFTRNPTTPELRNPTTPQIHKHKIWPLLTIVFSQLSRYRFLFCFPSTLTVVGPQTVSNIYHFQHNSRKKGDLGQVPRVIPGVPETTFFEHRFWDVFRSPFGPLIQQNYSFGAVGIILAALGPLLVSFWLRVDQFGFILTPWNRPYAQRPPFI